jgi:hypothetical protein
VNRFVTNAFRSVLGRAPDAGGRAYWSRVYQKAFDPSSVLIPIGASNEAIRRR